MTKREMALWYWAICTAGGDFPAPYYTEHEELSAWVQFWMEWPRQLYVEAGCPDGFPWRVD